VADRRAKPTDKPKPINRNTGYQVTHHWLHVEPLNPKFSQPRASGNR
jgi:hypothetical protein